MKDVEEFFGVQEGTICLGLGRRHRYGQGSDTRPLEQHVRLQRFREAEGGLTGLLKTMWQQGEDAQFVRRAGARRWGRRGLTLTAGDAVEECGQLRAARA